MQHHSRLNYVARQAIPRKRKRERERDTPKLGAGTVLFSILMQSNPHSLDAEATSNKGITSN